MPALVEAVADRPHHPLLLGGLEDVVVLDVAPGGLEVVVALVGGALVGLVEEIEFELGGEEGLIFSAASRAICFFRIARGECGRSSWW